MSRYNLIDEPWIPVLDLKGNRKPLGIRDTLINADSLACIEDPSPLVTAALHRFLLAVLYRALQGPCDIDEAKKLFREGLPKKKIRAYLEKWKERFYLFDKHYPFGQNRNVPEDEVEPWTKLTAEFNSTSSKVLFDHTDTTNLFSAPYDSIARWIVSTMNFSVRGGRGYNPSPSSDGLIVLPIGSTLFETLLFCLTPYSNRDVANSDSAPWERKSHPLSFFKGKPERASLGYADRYTWQSRAIRLLMEPNGGVKKVAFIPGVRHIENSDTESMVPLKLVKDKGLRFVQLEEKGIWRDFDSLLPNGTGRAPKVIDNMLILCGRNRASLAKSIQVIGQSFSNAKIEFWRMEKFALSGQMVANAEFCNDIRMLLIIAETTSEILNNACKEMGKNIIAHGERILEPDKWKAGKLFPGDVMKYVNSIGAVPQYWSTLEAKFHEVLRGYTLDKNPDDIHHDWLVAVRNALSDAWKLHQRSIAGNDAWGIRALVKAESIIGKKIAELNTNIQSLKEVP
ncbi:MAG: type I-E CRISPR-associated protein Cse1/CasA [Candidatus Aureabacteria bacterium]|nr:type I-E CRISPR-associated protein Cse1/CasA [Candidatus Auribacterota bacterium]